MAFTLPNFNLVVNLWRSPLTVVSKPTLTFMANLSRGDRVFVPPSFGDEIGFMCSLMTLLCPAHTDIRPTDDLVKRDVVEVPAASGRYYCVVMVDDTAKGFANEYRHAVIYQMTHDVIVNSGNPWACPPVPYPLP